MMRGSIKERTKCVICHTPATISTSMRTTCGHWTHTECRVSLGLEIDYDKCPKCLDVLPSHQTLSEPVTDDGIDYVLHPPSMSRLRQLRQVITTLARKQPADSPFSLLSKGPYQMPIESIIRDHHLGLQHMLRAGVTIDDFIKYGYGIEELMKFQDISGERGMERAHQALYALKLTPEHLLEAQLSLPVLQEELQVTPAVICSRFGLSFPEGGYILESAQSDNWTAKDVLALGFTMQDLIDHAGMQYIEQYIALEPTAEDERQLQATQTHIDQLSTLHEPEPEPRREVCAPAPAPAPAPVLFKQRRTRHYLLPKRR